MILRRRDPDLPQGGDRSGQEPDPVARVRGFVRRCRQLLGGPRYRAFVEILTARRREPGEEGDRWAQTVGEALDETWREVFGDLDLPKHRLVDGQRFAFALLSGIEAETVLFPGSGFLDRHLRILEETLLRLFGLEP